jgi:hypothetical protein
MNVVAQHVGFELRDSFASRDSAQMDEEQCAYAASLVCIYDGKGCFAALFRTAKVTANPYDVFATILAEDRRYPHMLVEIQLGKAAQLFIAQLAFVNHEPTVDGVWTKAPSMFTRALLVVGPDCADHDRSTIAHGFLEPIGSRIEI